MMNVLTVENGIIKAKPLTTSAGITVYSCTILNAENTATERTVITFTVPANTWKDGEMITVTFGTQSFQNSGSNKTLTMKMKYGSTTVIQHAEVIATNSVQANVSRQYHMIRIGNYIYTASYSDIIVGTRVYYNPPFGQAAPFGITNHLTHLTTNATGQYTSRYNTISFASDIVCSLTMQWSAAHASTYYRILEATAYKLNS